MYKILIQNSRAKITLNNKGDHRKSLSAESSEKNSEPSQRKSKPKRRKKKDIEIKQWSIVGRENLSGQTLNVVTMFYRWYETFALTRG